MSFWDLLLIGIGLSMDAFAVAIAKGLSVPKVKLQHAFIVGAYFGGFQALMPLIGYFLGSRFERFITGFDHWIVFGLLLLIGGNMIRESFGDSEKVDAAFGIKAMVPLAIATSIDALATGIGFAATGTDIWTAILLIGSTTFILSGMGVLFGHLLGEKYQSKAERIGGLVLIIIGAKILLEHLGVF